MEKETENDAGKRSRSEFVIEGEDCGALNQLARGHVLTYVSDRYPHVGRYIFRV